MYHLVFTLYKFYPHNIILVNISSEPIVIPMAGSPETNHPSNTVSIVPTVRQRELVDALPAPFVHEIPTDHAACVLRPDLFIPALTAALDEVTATR